MEWLKTLVPFKESFPHQLTWPKTAEVFPSASFLTNSYFSTYILVQGLQFRSICTEMKKYINSSSIPTSIYGVKLLSIIGYKWLSGEDLWCVRCPCDGFHKQRQHCDEIGSQEMVLTDKKISPEEGEIGGGGWHPLLL